MNGADTVISSASGRTAPLKPKDGLNGPPVCCSRDALTPAPCDEAARSGPPAKVPTLTSKSTTLGWGTLESHAGWEGLATQRVRSQSHARVMSAASMNQMDSSRISHSNNWMFCEASH